MVQWDTNNRGQIRSDEYTTSYGERSGSMGDGSYDGLSCLTCSVPYHYDESLSTYR